MIVLSSINRSHTDIMNKFMMPYQSLDFKWRFRMNNILDNNYIAESSTNRLYNSTDPNDKEYGTNGSINNIVYYGFGRTWNTSLSVKF